MSIPERRPSVFSVGICHLWFQVATGLGQLPLPVTYVSTLSSQFFCLSVETSIPCIKSFSPAFVSSDGVYGLPEEKEEIEDVLFSDMEQKVESNRKEENRTIEHGYRLKTAQQENLIGFEPEEDKGISINRNNLGLYSLFIFVSLIFCLKLQELELGKKRKTV